MPTPPFMDAQTTYGNGAVNTKTMGMNPYQQFEPRRMDQLFSLLGKPKQQQGFGMGSNPSGPKGPRTQALPEWQQQPKAEEAPREEWVDAPAMKRLAFGTTSATTRVKANSPAAQMTRMGVVGY